MLTFFKTGFPNPEISIYSKKKFPLLLTLILKNNFFLFSGNNELVLLQGNKLEDLIGVENEHIYEYDNFHMLSRSTPYLLKGMKNSIRIAHYNGLCLNPTIINRFDCTVTGSCIIKVRIIKLKIQMYFPLIQKNFTG